MMLRTAILIQMTFSLWFDDKAETFAFLALTRSSLTRSIADRSLSAKQTPAVEQVLKREIEHKNIIHDDGHYGILDGHIDPDHPTGTLITEKQKPDIQQEVAHALKTRAYPLFLLEKLFLNFEHFIDQNRNAGEDNVKERLVILGTGWGAAAILKEIDMNKFDVTIISPRNYFLFTPMLAGAAVGTVEFRSITEPVRHINPHANYIEASASDIDSKKCIVRCESVACVGTSCVIEEFTVPYDRLVVAVGAQTNTFGIPGVREHCCFLKQIEDGQQIRRALVNCFERASIPGLSDEQKEKILSFVVVGAGPAGIEFASELRDFITSDVSKFYGNILKHVRIKIIEASSKVLSPFDISLQTAAIEALNKKLHVQDKKVADLLPSQFKLTEILLESGVKEVKEDVVCLKDGREVPYGIAVWAAGNGPLPITLNIIKSLGEGEQADYQAAARGRIAIDPWLRSLGGEGKIFSFGDCSFLPSYQLPSTAQVASQQGEYLGRMLSLADMAPHCNETGELLPPRKDLRGRKEKISERIASFAMHSDNIAAPFQFHDLGILAYTGDASAVAQVQLIPNSSSKIKEKGRVGFGIWQSVYLIKQISFRNRFLVALDWAKTKIFGRDITLLM